MVIYYYSCETEGCDQWERVEHAMIPKEKPNPPVCKNHAKDMVRDWGLEQSGSRGSLVFPFVHPHLRDMDGNPVTVTSEAHYKQMCRIIGEQRYGDPNAIIPRPDKGYIEEEVYTDEKMNRRTREGSGVGLPGCWV